MLNVYTLFLRQFCSFILSDLRTSITGLFSIELSGRTGFWGLRVWVDCFTHAGSFATVVGLLTVARWVWEIGILSGGTVLCDFLVLSGSNKQLLRLIIFPFELTSSYEREFTGFKI